MKFPWTLTAVIAACYLTVVTETSALTSCDDNELVEMTGNDEVIKARVGNINLPFCAPYNKEVREFIKRYTVIGVKESEAMLGRTSLYFPIFEHYLRVHKLPEELKYLPMVESTLRPEVRSAAGAAGLWQFVPSSARHFGLKMEGGVDERLDPYRSTEAAVKLLATLYHEFGDWMLVMAAFNCGSGRVKKAIRYANSRDYWTISKYLPVESRRYVPSYIAAAYLVNYYNEHNLAPKYPSYQMQETRTFRVYTPLTFQQVAQVTGVNSALIKALNPSYLQQYIPANKNGNFVIVPASGAVAFRQHLAKKAGLSVDKELPRGKFKSSYVAVPGDRIESVAMLFRCDVEDLMEWNQLAHREVVVNQHLLLFLPENNKKVKP